MGKLRVKRYLETGTVRSLVPYVYVPKGQHDIRVVFNGTSCGLNKSLFALHFSLPTVANLLRSVEEGTFQADSDYQEMFYNFLLPHSSRPFAGVNISHIQTNESWESERERFGRNYFGQTDSPGRSIQMSVKGKQLAYGNHTDSSNPYHWEKIELNLPGDCGYDATKPWVSKRHSNGRLACDCSVYVDDGRHMGPDKPLCWRATQKICSHIGWLGMQDASRKCTKATRLPGPTAASMLHTEGRVLLTVLPEKWAKTQSLVRELDSLLRTSSLLPRLRLKQIRGFLIYVTRTYLWAVPYLKGLHLTIDFWQEGQPTRSVKSSGIGILTSVLMPPTVPSPRPLALQPCLLTSF